MDTMKRFHISGCVCYVERCVQQDLGACACVSLSPCVCDTVREPPFCSAEEIQGSSLLVPSSSLLAAKEQKIFPPSSFPSFLSLLSFPWWPKSSLFHLLPFFPLLLFLSEVCPGETATLDLSLWVVTAVGVLGKRLGHVGASKSPGLQQCPALPWLLEWPNGGLIACWHAACSLSLEAEVTPVP